MNRWQKEVQQSLLDSEEEVVKALEKQYKAALKDINEKIKLLESNLMVLDEALAAATDPEEIKWIQSMQRSKVYQKQYQEALNGQVSGILDKMHSDQYSTIDSYLHNCYETGYIGTMYDIAKQGIPIIQPINQAAVTKAILTDSKVKGGYYKALGVNVDNLKKVITHEISRGIASGLRYGDIARNIDNAAKTGFNNAYRIARTEGHRIQQSAAYDAQTAIKDKGIDILRQWDAVLDGRTRPSHRMLDGQIVGVDEDFEIDGKKVRKPGDFGRPEEDINCRCIVTTRIPEDLDEEELETLKQRAEFFGLDKSKQFDDFKEKYLNTTKLEQEGGIASPPKEYDGNFDDFQELNLSKAEVSAFSSLWNSSKESGHEYGVIIENGVVGKLFTSGKQNAVEIKISDSSEHITLLHSHTNATPPSAADFSKLLKPNVDKIGVVGYNGDTYVAYIGYGERPSIDEFNSIVMDIAQDVNISIVNDPSFFEWSLSERNYMAIREQAYRISREFGWTLEGGRIDVK